MEITVLIADDHQILRDGLKTVIERTSNIKVITEATDGREAVKLCKIHKPDVVLMDIAMPGLNGIEATRKIIQDNAEIKVVALSMHSDRQFIMGMFKAGAFGYLLKDSDADELITAINTVARNQKYISQKISGIILDEMITNIQNEESVLSSREKEILQLIAEGKTSREISEILFLSSKTVDAHRKNIMDKLGLFTISDLTKYAIKSGLTSLDDI